MPGKKRPVRPSALPNDVLRATGPPVLKVNGPSDCTPVKAREVVDVTFIKGLKVGDKGMDSGVIGTVDMSLGGNEFSRDMNDISVNLSVNRRLQEQLEKQRKEQPTDTPSSGSSSTNQSPATAGAAPPLTPAQPTSPDKKSSSRKITWKDLIFGPDSKPLGSGAYGTVHQAHVAMPNGDRKLVAVKQISRTSDGIEKEIAWLAKRCDERNHQNIVRTYNAFWIDHINQVWIVMEYMHIGSLGDILKKVHGRIEEKVVAAMAGQVLDALNFLHSQRHKLIHRDIKPDNLLINNAGLVKLADFGTTKEVGTLGEGCSTFCGTKLYMSSERLKGQDHGWESDIWSLGIVLTEVAEGRHPFPEFQVSQEVSYLDLIGAVDNSSQVIAGLAFSPSLKDFLMHMLQPKPRDRSPAVKLLEHPFILKSFPKGPVDPKLPTKTRVVRYWIASIIQPQKLTSSATSGGFR
eukprot:TRINITY_DN5864_c1_g1_i1.p1 TRINITY_DN5864_c1_g1~~TRINITY_DN5864_c1_g1_i1.p1  ORF type:complete len:461 (+),score=65.74 TRINITY_DN5864_c1_g1_i1:143-1525(+)